MLELTKHKNIYFIGVGGISMSALAMILKNRGYTVSGYDKTKSTTTEKLENSGIKIFYEYAETNCLGADLAVYNAAISPDDPEYKNAAEKKIPLISRAELLNSIASEYSRSIGVAGTHGKSTTSGMLSQIFLEYPDSDPAILVGAELPSINSTFRAGNGESFIFEACEYKDSFLKFFPKIAVVLNVELDHTDYFKSIEQMTESFSKFIRNTGKNGSAVINADSPNALKAAEGFEGTIITYSMQDKTCSFYPENIKINDDGTSTFDIVCRSPKIKEQTISIKLTAPGMHNISNALAAAAASLLCGVPVEAIQKGLHDFGGVRRRFEYKGECCGAKVYDDYAHHPSELKATIGTALKMQHKRLIAIFEPHTYTRVRDFAEEFAAELRKADIAVIAPIFAAREKNVYGVCQETLSSRIERAVCFDSFEQITEYVKSTAQKGDLIITMGAGNINQLSDMLVK